MDAFAIHNKRADGRQSTCKECKRAIDRSYYGGERRHEWYERKARRVARLRAIILTHLRSSACVDCGETDIVVLDFDHVRGSKSGNVMQMVMSGLSETAITNEMAKCEIRCANCHRRRTARQRGTWRALIGE